MRTKRSVSHILTISAIILAAVFMIVGMGSCSPAQRATKKYDAAKRIHLSTVAKLSQHDFPCGISVSDTIIKFIAGRTDTVVNNQIVEVDCPDVNDKGDTVYIKTKVNVPCRCPEQKADTLVRYITNFEKDPRDSIMLKNQEELTLKAEAKSSTWKTVAWIFIGLFGAGLLAIIIKILK